MHGGVQTFPILHGKPVSAEQFDVLDDSTKRALTEAEGKLTREVDKAAQLVRKQSAGFEAAREAAFSKAAAAIIDDGDARSSIARFGALGADVRHWLERVHQALVEDWDDLVEMEDEQRAGAALARGARRPRARDAPQPLPGEPARLARRRARRRPSSTTRTRRTRASSATSSGARASARCSTDFTRIRAGSLHKASGGVLVVRAADLLTDPIIWERMKRVLREQRIGAEDPLGPLGLYATSLRPVPVPHPRARRARRARRSSTRRCSTPIRTSPRSSA